MCTAATYKTKDFYFGRTLDYEFSYGDEVTVTPRHYEFSFRYAGRVFSHYAIIGMAHVAENYPLYYDGMNERGLAMAGLNFVGNAYYHEAREGMDNIAQFELIPWILSQCASVEEAKERLGKLNVLSLAFGSRYPVAKLHWLISDKNGSITVESRKDGLFIYNNEVGILTNNPPFDTQMFLLNNYMRLSPCQPENYFAGQLDLKCYSRGMGALGLPGDLSSASRFVRAAFTKMNSVSGDSESESGSQLFHILGSVEQQRGCCEVQEGKYEITIYTSCCNTNRGIYYYTTYGNHQISAVDMYSTDLDGEALVRYQVSQTENILWRTRPLA